MTDEEGMAPVYSVDRLSSTNAVVPPEKLDPSERVRIDAAASRARKVFGGPVGEFLETELRSWVTLSLRLDQRGLVSRMVNAILDMPIPETPKVV